METTNKPQKKFRKKITQDELTTVSGGSDKSGPQTGAVAPKAGQKSR